MSRRALAVLAAAIVGTPACSAPAAGGEYAVFTPATSVHTSATARTTDPHRMLTNLTIAPRGSKAGYTDKAFPHWSRQPAVGPGCDTREAVLRRDGRNVATDKQCRPVTGTWTSSYDSETWTSPADVDIDHVVPRVHAWTTGAAAWTQDQREAFANDLTRPELIAVTDNLNQQKGDKAPDAWKPPAVSAWCDYANAWITVKHHYLLTVTSPEVAALNAMLSHCPTEAPR